MGSITVILEDKIDHRLRTYITDKWSKRHGKITQVVEKALDDLLSKEGY